MKKRIKIHSWFLLFLVLSLPFVQAVQISQVIVQPKDTSALISWNTDVPANSFVRYGKEKTNLQIVGNAALVSEHKVLVENLEPQMSYYFNVESEGVIEDNSGDLYSFTTLDKDITAPTIQVVIPTVISGNQLDLNGSTESLAQVSLFVNGVLQAKVKAESSGLFVFKGVVLSSNQVHQIKLEAEDGSKNKAMAQGEVRSDSRRPVLNIENVPSLVQERSVTLRGKISEKSSYEVFVGDRSVGKGDSDSFEVQVPLTEGNNSILVKATDEAKLTSEKIFSVTSDTRPPTLIVTIEKGHEYFEGHAQSSISGKTEAESNVFLYVYRQVGYEFKPDFSKPREVVKANEQGEFTFEDVDFAASIKDVTVEKLVPKQVPSGLEDVTVFPIKEVTDQQQVLTYFIYVISEDQTGKSIFKQEKVTVQSCTSPNLDFGVQSLPQFQAPLRLVPQLLDDGRQEIQAVLQLSYNGDGIPRTTTAGSILEPGFKINNIRVDAACTQSSLKDEKQGMACRILPRQPQVITNADKSNVYLTWKLQPTAEFSERGEDFWNDLLKRQLVFPLRVTLNYQERTGENTFSDSKTQYACLDLGYAVDIPLDSKELIPDFLANEGVDAINATLTAIAEVRPVLEKVYIFAGVGCMGSFLGRTVARWYRIFSSKLEAFFDNVPRPRSDDEGKCPISADLQAQFYLEETIKDWQELMGSRTDAQATIPAKVIEAYTKDGQTFGEASKKISLEFNCPRTAEAWKWEATIDQAYKWLCDRAFCRAVPAGWTSEAEDDKIGTVIFEQQQCAVTGRGEPLIKLENCQELVKANVVKTQIVDTAESTQIQTQTAINVCWRARDGTLYYEPEQKSETGIYKLKPFHNIQNPLQLGPELEAYKPEGADTFIVRRSESCSAICTATRKDKSTGTFGPDREGGNANGCYEERVEGSTVKLYGKNNQPLKGENKYPAGYSSDCFINEATNTLLQCVCAGEKTSTEVYANQNDHSLRSALVEKNDVAEKWSYREDQIFKDTNKRLGTYYSPQRYYSGRDFSGAFGADYILDYFNTEVKDKTVHEVNPHTQILGTFQSVCLSGILKYMRMLESMLQGLQNCIVEAKHTGIADAGTCKAIFTQQVCGLAYKAIAYLTDSCSPLNFDDVQLNQGEFPIGEVLSHGFDAMGDAVDSSISDIRAQYGNAQLNQFLKAGTQGLTQSMCLAAFGVEFPLFSQEFLLDAAYSFPTKTSVVMVPRERELSSYNPAKQTAIFNYNIGTLVFPGCKIKGWEVGLKCISSEDLVNTGVDTSCNGKGCDCLSFQPAGNPIEVERTKRLAGGFNLESGKMFSVPIETPQRVDSHYRYDHVYLKLELDPSEKGNAEKCFDPEYRRGNGAIFYEPLVDISPPAELSCSASLTTGRYTCPELSSLFGFGGASLEAPYVMCYNSRLERWMDCEKTPNLFVEGDEIKVRVHLNQGSEGKCLRRVVRGVPGLVEEAPIRQLPNNVPGPSTIEENLGIVKPEMFGGSSPTLQLVESDSNSGCRLSSPLSSPATASKSPQLSFRVELGATDPTKLKLKENTALFDSTADYGWVGGYLQNKKTANSELTRDEINNIIFNFNGFKINKVLGLFDTTDSKQQCTYQIVAESKSIQQVNTKIIQVNYELVERDEGGLCSSLAQVPVKTSQGKAAHTQPIRIQRQLLEVAAAQGFDEAFQSGTKYGDVIAKVRPIVQQKQGTIEDATALYYWIASLIMLQKAQESQIEIRGLLKLFFTREGSASFGKSLAYSSDAERSGEFQKIKKYLCLIDADYGAVHKEHTYCKT